MCMCERAGVNVRAPAHALSTSEIVHRLSLHIKCDTVLRCSNGQLYNAKPQLTQSLRNR